MWLRWYRTLTASGTANLAPGTMYEVYSIHPSLTGKAEGICILPGVSSKRIWPTIRSVQWRNSKYHNKKQIYPKVHS